MANPSSTKKTSRRLVEIIVAVIGVLVAVAAWLLPRSPQDSPSPSPLPQIYAVRVQVLDPQGLPVSGSTIRSSAGNEPQRTPDGWWEVEIPAAKVPAGGQITLWAEHPDWQGSRVDVLLGGDPNVRVEIRLQGPKKESRAGVPVELKPKPKPQDDTPSVPASEPSAYAGEQGSEPASYTHETLDFLVILEGCSLKGGTVDCRLTITAKKKDKNMIIWGRSRLIDESSDEHLASYISLGSNETNRGRHSGAQAKLTRGIPLSGRIQFEGVPSGTQRAKLIELVLPAYEAQFKDVILK